VEVGGGLLLVADVLVICVNQRNSFKLD
jgi:hypothetical protein